MNASDAVTRLRDKFADAILADVEFRGEKTVSITVESLPDVAKFCRDELGFDYLVDISSLDHFGASPRFEMVYELCVLESGTHLRIKSVLTDEVEPVAPSVAGLWPTADWHEREVFDMMGIRFAGHPDLRRILMWDGYPYYPLRKDFPLAGKTSDVPSVAFTEPAPLAGGPFVTVPTEGTTQVREPRARRAGDDLPRDKFIAEP